MEIFCQIAVNDTKHVLKRIAKNVKVINGKKYENNILSHILGTIGLQDIDCNEV